MSAATTATASSCRIEGPTAIDAHEFKAFLFPLVGPATAEMPAPPGAVQHDGAGRTALLHFAPGRFLAPAPGADTIRHLAALAAAGLGADFEVTGKWRAIRLLGPGAERIVSAGIDVGAVLSHRECAAVELFGCPVVLARSSDGFDLFVQSSYATDLAGTLERLRATARAT